MHAGGPPKLEHAHAQLMLSGIEGLLHGLLFIAWVILSVQSNQNVKSKGQIVQFKLGK
jgi:hypothetical protein